MFLWFHDEDYDHSHDEEKEQEKYFAFGCAALVVCGLVSLVYDQKICSREMWWYKGPGHTTLSSLSAALTSVPILSTL